MIQMLHGQCWDSCMGVLRMSTATVKVGYEEGHIPPGHPLHIGENSGTARMFRVQTLAVGCI